MNPFVEGPANPDAMRDGDRLKAVSRTPTSNGIVRGRGYVSEWIVSSLPSGSKTYAEFEVPSGVYMALDFREVVAEKEKIYYRVYSSYPDVTKTTALSARNLRSDGAALVISPFHTCSSPTADPLTAILTVPVFGQPAGGGKASGDISTDNVFRLLAPESVFLLELENDSTQSSYVQLTLAYRFIPITDVQAVG